MSWVLICDACEKKDRKPIGYLPLLDKQCALCKKPLETGQGIPWRTQENPTTPSSGNACD